MLRQMARRLGNAAVGARAIDTHRVAPERARAAAPARGAQRIEVGCSGHHGVEISLGTPYTVRPAVHRGSAEGRVGGVSFRDREARGPGVGGE